MLLAGEGTTDITPPVGSVLAGFHYTAGKERRATAARMPSQVRALYLKLNEDAALLFSVDVIAFPRAFCERVQREVAATIEMPEAHIFVSATHTHSAPTLIPLLQWGEVSPAYADTVAAACVSAAKAARADASESDLYYGAQNVEGGNSNRTAKTWKTDATFGPDATDKDRWLDTLLQVIYFQRADNKPALAWYHFCAHPVCYQDTQTGPDWPGLVAQKLFEADNVRPSFLQGHIGDVNPGDGTKWIGDAEPTSTAIGMALHHAMNHSEFVELDKLRVERSEVQIPYDLKRFQEQLAFYREHAEECTKDTWVDADFSKAWYADAQKWDLQRGAVPAPLAALRIGPIGLLFHPAELYSYYGLKLRTTSPLPHTLAVGFTGDELGYLTDPTAYEKNEYAAIVVPKIIEVPPYAPEAAQVLTSAAGELLHKVV